MTLETDPAERHSAARQQTAVLDVHGATRQSRAASREARNRARDELAALARRVVGAFPPELSLDLQARLGPSGLRRLRAVARLTSRMYGYRAQHVQRLGASENVRRMTHRAAQAWGGIDAAARCQLSGRAGQEFLRQVKHAFFGG